MDFKEGMICPVCESGKLVSKEKDLELSYKGKSIIAHNSKSYECNLCNESFFSQKDENELEKFLTDSRRKIDGLLTSDEIKRIRLRFAMTQVDFAKALRVGEKNFARYETGKAVQSFAMDDLLRVLDLNPKAINAFYSEWNEVTSGKVFEIQAFISKKKAPKEVTIKTDPGQCIVNF